MATPTANFNILKPAVGGNTDDWGGITNDNWDKTDTLLLNRLVAKNPGDAAGTAATADKQTSPNDTTAGALMAVGAGGLVVGGQYSGTDLNDIVLRGMQYAPSSFSNKPRTVGGSLINIGSSDDTGSNPVRLSSQIFIETGTGGNDGRMFFRRSDISTTPATFTTWRELYHTGNLDIEEGNWTASFRGGGAVFRTETGRYRKSGNVVTVVFSTSATLSTNPGGTFEIKGLPFIASGESVGSVSWRRVGTGFTDQVSLFVAGSSTIISPIESNDSSAFKANTTPEQFFSFNGSTANRFRAQITYFTNE